MEQSGPIADETITAASIVDAAINGFEYRPLADGRNWALMKKERHLVLVVNPAGQSNPIINDLTNVLNLKPDQNQYELVAAVDVTDSAGNPTVPTAELQFTPRSSA